MSACQYTLPAEVLEPTFPLGMVMRISPSASTSPASAVPRPVLMLLAPALTNPNVKFGIFVGLQVCIATKNVVSGLVGTVKSICQIRLSGRLAGSSEATFRVKVIFWTMSGRSGSATKPLRMSDSGEAKLPTMSPDASSKTRKPGRKQVEPGGSGVPEQFSATTGQACERSVTTSPAIDEPPDSWRVMNVPPIGPSSVKASSALPSRGSTSTSMSSSRARVFPEQPRVPPSHSSPSWTM